MKPGELVRPIGKNECSLWKTTDLRDTRMVPLRLGEIGMIIGNATYIENHRWFMVLFGDRVGWMGRAQLRRVIDR